MAGLFTKPFLFSVSLSIISVLSLKFSDYIPHIDLQYLVYLTNFSLSALTFTLGSSVLEYSTRYDLSNIHKKYVFVFVAYYLFALCVLFTVVNIGSIVYQVFLSE